MSAGGAALALVLAATDGRALATPVVTGTSDQVLATLNRAWTANGDAAFVRLGERGPHGVVACSGEGLCITQEVEGGAVRSISLIGDVGGADRSRRYLRAQAMLIGLSAPGAPARPAVTADRLAVDDGEPASAQLGPTCMRVTPKTGHALDSVFSRGRCGP